MRSPRLLVIILAVLSFFNTDLSAQMGQFSLFPVPTQDSLAGFNEAPVQQIALKEGIFGLAYQNLLAQKKRLFVNQKYKLYSAPQGGSPMISFSNAKPIGGMGAVINASPCVNEGFESNSLNGWSTGSGFNGSNSCATVVTTGTNPVLAVMSTPFTDAIVGTVPNSPFTGSKVLMINDAIADNGVTRISQTFPVTTQNFLYEFAYLAVMATQHSCCEQTYMQVKLYNFQGNPISCPLFTFAPPPPSGPICSSPGIAWTSTTSGGLSVAYNATWENYSIDLTNYMNQNITIEVTVADCIYGGHWGYAYFDSNCNQLGFTLNNTTFVAAPTQTANISGLCNQTATITAPVGLGPYSWTGPSAFTSTNQTIATSVPGNYTLSMLPPGNCGIPITRIINLTFPPPTTITASSNNLCASGTNTAATLTAIGASAYTWQPGGSTSSVIVVSPSATQIYTVTAQTGTCIGTYTTQINVNPDPSVSVLASSYTICPGQSATLTAIGANSYVWNPGGLTGSIVAVSPTSSTSYTTTGTSTAGCIANVVTAIAVTSAPTVAINTSFTSTNVCVGANVTLIATGASIVWQPGGSTNGVTVFNPTVTTTYTAFGSSGSCTSSATQLIIVDPGPPITVVANPTISCPGNTTTLTASSSSAVGAFTWQPSGSNSSAITVTTALAGGYSVSAINAHGCTNTQTFNPTYNATPIIVVTPGSPSVCAGSSITLSASGGVSYTWNPTGQVGTNAVFTPSATTTYTVIGENAAGCIGQTTVSIVVVSIPVINASASPTAVCAGSCATITPGGASSYNISGGSFIVCPSSSSTFTIVGTSANGCVSNPITVAVAVNSLPVITASANPSSICAGSSSTLTASGGVSYVWSDGSVSAVDVVAPPSSIIFTVIGTDALGCSNSTIVPVIVIPLPAISISPAAATICPAGSVSPLASGATNYTWMPGGITGSNPTLNPSATTIYTVTGATGACTGQTLFPVTVAPAPVITATYAPGTICAGNCATLITTGAATNFIVTGLTPVACPTITTNYTVVGVSADGCLSNTVTGTLFVNSIPSVFAFANPTSICPGDSSLLTATGANTYTWFPGGFAASSFYAKPTVTTTYSVVGTNASGCVGITTVAVVVNPIPVIGITPASTTICPGASATLSATGATSYTWFPGGTGTSIVVSPSVTTTYSVIGSNGGCTDDESVVVTVAPAPVISASFNPSSICAGSCATIVATGASTYSMTGLSGVACPAVTSNYTIVGISSFGCNSLPIVGTLTVLPAPNISASASPTLICAGDITTISGIGGVSYNYMPGSGSGSSFIDTPSLTTTYTVTGTDASGCTNTAAVTVSVNSIPTVFAIATPTAICSGNSAVLNAAGGTTYSWSPGFLSGSTVTVSPVVTTIYTVTAFNGICSGITTVQVDVDSTPIVTITPSSPSVCAGNSVSLFLSGGSTYVWDDGSTNGIRIITPSVTTTYSVIPFSTNGCAGLPASITITVHATPFINATANPTNICAGGSSNLTATGGVTYSWTPVNMTGASISVSPSVSTVYQVTGTDSFGCSAPSNVTVAVSAPLNITASASQSVLCGSSIVTTLSASGGATSYLWLPTTLTGSVVNVIPVVSTNYTLLASNGGCTTQVIVPVIVNPSITVNVTASSNSLCAGSCATLTATGASSYTWSTGSTGPSVVVCPSTTATYSALGSAGSCTNIGQTVIVVNSIPNLSISGTQNTLCPSNPATLTASGALTYSWSTGSTNSVIVISPLSTTIYTVIGFNANCSAVKQYTQTVVAPGNFTIVASSPSICAGFTVGLLAVGATGNYTWQPNGFVGNPLVDSPASTTTYTANLNNGGCPTTATISVVVVPLPNVQLSANPTSVCVGGTVTLTASGATTYSWIPTLVGGNTFTATQVVATTYTVVGFDAVGCPNADTITVGIINPAALTASTTSSKLCSGSPATLTAVGSTNYTWTPGGQTGASVVVTPTSTTVYTVTGGNAGCLGTTTVGINVDPLPNISASASNPSICPGASVQLNATGGISYTWNPTGLTGQQITDIPVASTNYTVSGTDANGCTGTANVFVFVNPMSNITAIASPSNICAGDSTTLTAGGGLSYTWNPGGQTTQTLIVNPPSTTVYTLQASDASGCTGAFSVVVNVTPIPTINITPQNFSVCIGSTATLTATGAGNYTWLPSGSTSSVDLVSPIVPTTYTVIGDNNGICAVTQTVTVFVNPLPANVAATSAGTVSCATPSAQLFGVCTDTNVSYFWASATFSVAGQNPVISGVWGVFTLSVIDNVTGCVATATTLVPTDNSIPSVTATTSGSITCAVTSVILNAANTTTNPGYSWTGPSAFSSTVQSPTITVHGSYTIVVTDLTSLCTASAIVNVNTHTSVAMTASISPATCNNGSSNNDGSISISGFTVTDKYDLVSGATYTGTATYATAAFVPISGFITNNLANPTTTLAYTLRLFDGQGCIKDTTLYLIPVDCSLPSLGIAKAVSVPQVNSDGSYNLTYTVVLKNYSSGPLNIHNLLENLSTTFPAPTSFTVDPSSMYLSANSGLSLNNAAFDGSSQTNLISGAVNILSAGATDTIKFDVKVKTAIFFTNFKNTIIGSASDINNKIISDSSNAGLDPDRNLPTDVADGNPTNNNVPTSVMFEPNKFFGITKAGEIHKSDNDSYDVTYTITVHNLGNDTLRNVILKDSLFEMAIKNPVTYSMRSGPVSGGGGLTANSAYNGNTDISLVDPSNSKINPGTISYVYFTINVVPGTVTAISNSAYGSAVAAISLTGTTVLSDTSNAGNNPDVNGNGVWNEPSDNVPTVLLVPNTHTLFIPEGFSPDGDANNQYFVIQGLSELGNNSLTIFNRWGNKVYSTPNYDNTWDGTPNVSGTIGKDKLPPGTYYYILEMKGSDQKPITGFVVLQY